MSLGLLVPSENVDTQTDVQDPCFISIDYAIRKHTTNHVHKSQIQVIRNLDAR